MRLRKTITTIVATAILLAGWQLFAVIANQPELIPSLPRLVRTLCEWLVSGSFYQSVGATILRGILGMSISFVCAIGMAGLFARFEWVYELLRVTWNQSVMELGAVICTAKSPLCDTCPIADDCAFLKAGRPGLGERRTRPRQRFQGTDRQVRGLVLAALRELPAGATLPREDADKLWKDQIQLAACIASLDDDGLIEILDGGLRLPS